MEHLKSRIENMLKEVMEDVEYTGLEHFRMVWTGKFKIDRDDAIKYINRKSSELEVFPMLKKKNNNIKIIFFPERKQKKSKIWINIFLLIVTIFTTLAAGALQQGVNPFLPPGNLLLGLPFSISILLILGSHELGHYFTARKNNVDATFPYFIPAPHLIGTFGAVIKMKSPISDKNALIEIGAAGPIIGFILSIIAFITGLSLSRIIPTHEGGLLLGDSIITYSFTRILFPVLPEGKEILLHPVAFAGWIGFFVTAINLLPMGQLDGGHISYVLFRKKYKIIAYVIFAGLLISGIFWLGWLIWGVFIFILVGFNHPPPLDNITPVSKRSLIIGYISFIIFILTFVPNPFQLI